MKILNQPYIESGLSEEQNHLRQNGIKLVQFAIKMSSFLTNGTKIIGFADNGISAVIAFVERNQTRYVLKIKPEKVSNKTIYNFLAANKYEYSLQFYEEFNFTFQNIDCNATIFEYIDSERASHADLTNYQIEQIMIEAGKAIAKLHKFKTINHGEVLEYSTPIKAKDKVILDTLSRLFENSQFIQKFSNERSVLCHHALGLHNAFYFEKKLKIFDFKPILLPKEFDLAMFIIWNKFRGDEYIELFLESYKNYEKYDEGMLNTALFLEYGRKLKTWKKRLRNNPKVKDWIQNGKRERGRLKSLIK